mgnify:CR=1 FL=1
MVGYIIASAFAIAAAVVMFVAAFGPIFLEWRKERKAKRIAMASERYRRRFCGAACGTP